MESVCCETCARRPYCEIYAIHKDDEMFCVLYVARENDEERQGD